MKKTAGLFICGAVLSALLAGCTQDGGYLAGTQTDGKPDPVQEGERDPLTITCYNNLIKENFIKAFREVHPEVDLEIASYAGGNGSAYAQYSLEHGDIPDIYVTTQNFALDAQEKYLLDLSNYDFVNNYATSLLDAQDINGGIYLLPSGYQLIGMYYNKTLMEENNWTLPQDFDGLVALSEQIEAAGYRTMGNKMDLDGFPFSYFFNVGNTLYFGTPEGTQWKEDFPAGKAKAAGNDGLKETAEYFRQWVDQGFITVENMDVSEFSAGGSVFYLCLGLNEYEFTTKDGKTYEFGTMPWLGKDSGSSMLTRNVTRYIGINKKLAEPGNEQKLEDALKFMDFISTAEGQRALMSASNYMSPLNEDSLPEDSPYNEIADIMRDGRTVPMLYTGWEEQIIPIAGEIKTLIRKEVSVDTMLENFDRINEGLLDKSSEDIYAVAPRTMTIEETARLVAVAEGRAAGADCAMVSLNRYHGEDLYNKYGLGWYIYEGNVNTHIVNMVAPRSSGIVVLEMTGAEIKAMQEAGFDANENGNPYEYVLVTKGDMELEDTATYRIAISAGELEKDRLDGAEKTEISPAEAVKAYLKELGTASAEAVSWN